MEPIFPSTLVKYQEAVEQSVAKEKWGEILNVASAQAEKMSAKPILTNHTDVLMLVLPPRVKDGWVQAVSPDMPSRSDVRELTNLFDFKLEDSKARISGICNTRSAIYSMCFNELIRQVTVDCPERGLLLLRIRDENRMTAEAYKTLYEASVGLGRRKAVEAERGKQNMMDRTDVLQNTRTDLLKEVKRLEAKLKAMERCCQEQQQADQKKFTEEISFLEHTNKRLEEQEATIKRLQEEEKKKLG
eukprot:TRINITY_DN7730_c0_g1_i1.p1 TRINITY_DN7730_c0_g1~~TRINITY_DN7730_c0_g1_i1.p1  ORF type:complete len:252 (+),score=65.94 TRINITY_DN7730_c0_g1_i1:23-757(+)